MSNGLNGVITALVTPFKNGQLDERSFLKLLRHQLDQGIKGFVINGTTAESPTLEFAEVEKLFHLAKAECAGQAQLIVGTGGNSTARTCELSRMASAWQPEALLVVVPYYNRPPQRGLKAHFVAVAKASSVPVLLYNVPSRTVASLEPETIAELAQVENIVGLKDATGDLETLAKLRSHVPASFALLSGDDASSVEFCKLGGQGVISVSSHIIGREMSESLAKGAVTQFTETYADLLCHLYIEANPIAVKMALHWMGLLDSPELRLPLDRLDQKFHKDFKACLEKLGKL